MSKTRMAKKVLNETLRREVRLKIEETLKNLSPSNNPEDFIDVNECRRVNEIIKQLREIGLSKVTNCDKDFQSVTFTHSAGHENLNLTVTLSKKFPSEAPICEDDLPKSFALKKYSWNSEKSTLAHIFATFVERVDRLIPVWQNLRELDKNTRILDPTDAASNIFYRRIFVSEGISILITITDIEDVYRLPNVQVLGPDTKIKQLKEKLATGSENYDPQVSLLENLQAILGVEFPTRSSTFNEEIETGDCGICYNFNLEGLTPTKSCQCGYLFHNTCLYEWLKSIPENRTTLNTIYGKCPNCDKPISCPVVLS